MGAKRNIEDVLSCMLTLVAGERRGNRLQKVVSLQTFSKQHLFLLLREAGQAGHWSNQEEHNVRKSAINLSSEI